jgi:hypothetical protein
VVTSTLWDRILGRRVTEAECPVQPGRYRTKDASGHYDIVPIVDGSAELPGRAYEASQPSAPADLDLDARAIEMLADNRASSGQDDLLLALGLEPAEQDDAALIGFLDALDAFRKVMNDPAELLERHDELAGMGRGGRITPRTLRRLASHADDWRTRRGHSVEPHRLLVERLYPNLDRAENRLVINTLVLLKQRLDLLADDAAGQSDFKPQLEQLHYRASQRSTHLWGRSVSGRSEGELAESLQRRTADLVVALTALANLASSPLGQALSPWRQRSADGAFGSNLLRDHEAYSKIGRLWHQLSADADLDESARRAVAVAREQRFDDYVFACVQLAVQDWAALQPQAARLISMPSIRREPDGSIVVTAVTDTGDRRAVRVVPQFMGLDDGVVDVPSEGDRSQAVIIARSVGRAEGVPLRIGGFGAGTVVGVGPYALTSVEVLGSALRWHLEAEEFLRYPRRLRLPQNLAVAAQRLETAGLTTRMDMKHQLAIVSVDQDGDLAALALSGVSSKDRTDQLAAAVERLRVAVDWTYRLRRCPTCGTRTQSFESEEDRFHARCVSCDATWGVDRCPNEHRRPFLRFPKDGKDRGLDRWAPGDDDPCPTCVNPKTEVSSRRYAGTSRS